MERNNMTDIKWLMASDVHFPRHDPRLVSLWFDVLAWMKPQAIDLLGDIDDADGTSRWAQGTSREGFSLDDAGVTDSKKFLADIHAKAKKADKHFHDGNHGWFRHKKWLDKNDPESLVVGRYTPEVLYEAKDSGFEWHEYDKPPVRRYGDIFAHHGSAISKHSAESVRNDVLNWGVSLVRGHSHRQGEFFYTYPLEERTLRGYEIGHLCDPRKAAEEYDVSPNWQAGFAVGLVHGDDVFIDTIEIRNYTCVVFGKVFEG
jgi:hypothetical protein